MRLVYHRESLTQNPTFEFRKLTSLALDYRNAKKGKNEVAIRARDETATIIVQIHLYFRKIFILF